MSSKGKVSKLSSFLVEVTYMLVWSWTVQCSPIVSSVFTGILAVMVR